MPNENFHLRIQSFAYRFGTVAILIFIWAWYLLEHFTSWRMHDYGQYDQHTPLPIAIPIITSILIPMGAFILWKRAAGIIAHGVPVTANVKSIGIGYKGLREVTFTYLFQGTMYRKKKSISRTIADQLTPGGPLPILVDQRHPKRVLIC